MIKAVIFDMDGVIFDTEKLLCKYWIQSAKDFGFDMPVEIAHSLRSFARKPAGEFLRSVFGESFDYMQVRAGRMKYMAEHISEYGLEKKPGIDQLLQWLKSTGIPVALATATDPERAGSYLKAGGIYDFFDKIICASMVKSGKPEPDIYLYATEQLGLAPEECIAVEDSPNGVISAGRAGCKTIMVPDLTPPTEALKPHIFSVCEKLTDIIDVVKMENHIEK